MVHPVHKEGTDLCYAGIHERLSEADDVFAKPKDLSELGKSPPYCIYMEGV